MRDAASEVWVDHYKLEELVTRIFVKAGLSPEDAGGWARSLVEANLRGVDSHGVQRVPRYLELIQLGEINVAPKIKIVKEAGALALLDADRAPGPIGMGAATDAAIKLAREFHVGWCVARDITHAGAIRQYVEMIAENGMVGIAATASGPLMAYPGSIGAVVSTNPVAIAVPKAGDPPIILDFATSAVAYGQILAARKMKEPIPEGWGLDDHGLPTTDPMAVKTMVPMAGIKGAGLSLMIEILASISAGNEVLEKALTGTKGTRMNGFVVAVNLPWLRGEEAFRASVASLADIVAAQPHVPEVDRLTLPGERGDSIKKQRLNTGIPLPKQVWDDLYRYADL